MILKNQYLNSFDMELKPQFDFAGIGASSIIQEAENKIDQLKAKKSKQENNFPVNAFPPLIQDIINATNDGNGFPVDYIGASLLYAASVAIGNTYKIQAKYGWTESAVLYLAIVGMPGVNKSAPLAYAVSPIADIDARAFVEYERRKAEYDTLESLSRKDQQEQGFEEPAKPVWYKYIVSDATPEALAEVHKFNKRGIGLKVDELASWFKNFNRYNKGSESEFWNSTWDSQPINIDRKTSESVLISSPFISVAGTIQPGILFELGKDSRAQTGFIDRILFAFPAEVKKDYWSESETDPIHTNNWRQIIRQLTAMSVEVDETLNPVPTILKFSPEARGVFIKWNNGNVDQINQMNESGEDGVRGKFDKYVLRLALILEMLNRVCDQSAENAQSAIGVSSIEGAIDLVEYFKRCAIRVHSVLNNTNPLELLPINKQQLYAALPDKFNTGDGLAIADGYNIQERTFKNFIKNMKLFKRTEHGQYEKIL